MSDHETTTGTDDRISTLFHGTTAHIQPDVDALVKGGIDRGRVKRRRRTIGTAFTAVATVGIVAVAASVAPGLGSGKAGVEPAGASVSATTPSPRAVGQPEKRQTKPGKPPQIPLADIPVKAADLPRLFTKLYPGKVTPADERTGRITDDGRAGQYAHFLWNGFQTTVAFVAYTGTPAQKCREVQHDASQSKRPPVKCRTRPDGTILVTGGETAPARDGGGSVRGAFLFTKDGYEISVLSYNTARKEGPLRASRPPFSIAQLVRAVTSDVWF